MTVTTQEMMGDNALLVVREVNAPPSDADAEKVGVTLHASAVVEVTWPESDRHRAKIRVHVAGEPSWSEREIPFTAADPPIERGRSLALNIASLVPTTPPAAVETAAVAPTPSSSAPPAAASKGTAEVATARIADTAETGETEASKRSTHGAVDFLALVTGGLDGPASGLGGEVGLSMRIIRGFDVRAAGGVVSGDITSAAVTTRTHRLGLGAAWWMWQAPHLALGLRVEARAVHHGVTHARDLGAAASQDARWIPAGAATVEASWAPFGDAALVLGGGVEEAFGATQVVVDGVPSATIPRTRIVLEFGLRARF